MDVSSAAAPRHAPKPDLVSLELLLDDETESRVRAQWRALADAGLSSLGAHPSPSNRPHITLMVRPSIPAVGQEEVAVAVPLPLPVELGAIVLFGAGERRVLARSVVPTPELLRAHRALHDLVTAGPEDNDAPHTRPGEWTPHVTLARRLRLDAIPQALRLIEEQPHASARGAAVGLRRWDAASGTITRLL